MRIIILIALVILTAGCTKSSDTKKSTPQKPSIADEMIDGVTGRTAVRHGRKAMDTIERVSKQEAKELEEVLGK